MEYLPIALRLKEKNVLVVGGGAVAERKVGTLLSAGARIHVVAPVLSEELGNLQQQGRINWRAGEACEDDVADVDLVIAATNNTAVNQNVSRWARQKKIKINVVDAPQLCDFISPALFESEQALIAVYSDGKDPVLSRDLKNYIKEKWDDFLQYRNRS